MFLRIDVYPGGLQPAPPAKGTKEGGGRGPAAAPSETLYAYPALVKDDKRTLFEVGRKDPIDILLAQDKSVSRMHCKFVLSPSDGATAPSSNPLTLENLGKTGCFVVAERPRAELGGDGDDDPAQDDGNDSDATDADAGAGHGASTQPAGATQTQRPLGGALDYAPPMSEAAERALRQRGLNPDKYRLETVGLDQSRKLTELDKDKSFVVVQCGKFDSTLVLTRNDMVVPSKARTLVDAKLCESVGARLEPRHAGPFTHCVAKKYSTSPHTLASWCRGVEFVTPDYLHTLAERDGPGDGMPNLDDYRPAPSSSSSSSSQDDFWFKAPPSWEGWTFLAPSAASDDDENLELMRSTRANVRTVDKESDLGEAIKAIAKTQASSDESRPKVFAMTHGKWLTKAQLERAGVVVVGAKILASRLTKFLAPDGTELEAPAARQPLNPNAASAVAAGSSVPDPREQEPLSPRVPNAEDEHPESGESKLASDETKQAAEAKGSAPEETLAEATAPATETARPSKRPSKRAMESPPAPSGPALERSTRRKSTAAAPTMDARAAASSMDVSAAHQEKDPDSKERGESPRSDIDEEEKYIELVSRPRKLAKPSSDGWLFPAGSKRRKDGDSSEYVRIKSTAVTDVVKGFVLKQPLGQSRSSATRTGERPDVVDFRGFRKNHVTQARTFASISMVSVQPKEAQVAHQMEEQRHQLEERQRMADDLFRDPEFPGGRAKTRR